MAFLNPLLLLGLMGVAVPIAIHLFNRFRPKPVQWAAIELLRKALQTRSRQVKVEDLLMLLLRCMAIALVALAMARPTLTDQAARLFGGTPRPGVVLAIDGSFSMQHRPGVSSRFDYAMQRARDVLATLEPGSPLTIVLMGQRPRVILRNTGYDPQTIEATLRDVTALPDRLQLDANLETVDELVREIRAPVREVYLITDAQAAAWDDLSQRSRGLMQQISNIATLMVLPVAAEGHDNLAITSLELASGALRRGGSARYVASIANFGPTPRQRVVVRLLQDGEPVDQRVIDTIDAGDTVDVPLYARLEQAGVMRLTAQLGADPLPADNTRHATALVRNQVRVLLVDGRPSLRPFDSATDFLVTALAPRQTGGEGSLSVMRVGWLDLGTVRFGEYDVIVLADVPDLRDTQATELRRFVEEGGGLLVFLGQQTDSRVYNARWVEGEQPLLPARLGEPQGQPLELRDEREASPWSIRVAPTLHPITRVLTPLSVDLLDQARLSRLIELQPLARSRVLLDAVGPRTLPLMIDHTFGQGNVVLFASTPDREWSDWVIHPIYPIVLHQSVTYLSRAAWEHSTTVGQPLTIALARGARADTATFSLPKGDPVSVRLSTRNGQPLAELPEADWPGFYELTHDPSAPTLAMAVNVDTSESNVRALDSPALSRALSGLAVRQVDPNDNVGRAIRDSRVGRELWRQLILLALVVLVLELFLGWRFTRRAQQASPVSTTRVRESIREPEETAREAA